jgi:protein involved in polysaccharide export with SLBB domain
VIIVGAVNSPRGILYEPGKRLEYYLALSGGFAPDAAKDRIEVFHMGGGVIPANRARELKPGDVVFVPTKVLAAKIAGKSNGFDSFFKSITSTALLFRLFGL